MKPQEKKKFCQLMSLMSHSSQGSVLPNYIALIICNYGEKIEVLLCLKEKFQTKGDAILGHALNEGLLNLDSLACIMELC